MIFVGNISEGTEVSHRYCAGIGLGGSRASRATSRSGGVGRGSYRGGASSFAGKGSGTANGGGE